MISLGVTTPGTCGTPSSRHRSMVRALRPGATLVLVESDSAPLIESVTRLWNSTQYYRRAFMLVTGPQRRWVVNAEHALLLDAIRRGDLVDAERFSCGHIRRTRIELQQHPELFPPR